MHVERAFQLLNANRADLAEREFRAALTERPSDALALAGLAMSLSALDRTKDALATARSAVGAGPDLPMARGALAQALLANHQPKEALVEANAAIAMDPINPSHHGLSGLASLSMGLAADALAAANKGLAIDADSEMCSNVRGLAMARLNRRDDAETTLRTALARNPESPYAHAALGHTLLLQGKPTEAAEHFRQALRRDPGNEFAREGLLHTLRSRIIVYRAFLWWLSFCHRMRASVLTGVIVASFIIPQVLAGISARVPSAAIFILPVRLLFLGFVILTWIGVPLFNGLLLLTRDGRLLLRPAERGWGVVTVVMLLLPLGLIAAAIGSAPSALPFYKRGIMVSLFLLLPIGMCAIHWTKRRERITSLIALAVLVGFGARAIVAGTVDTFTLLAFGYIILINVSGLATSARKQ